MAHDADPQKGFSDGQGRGPESEVEPDVAEDTAVCARGKIDAAGHMSRKSLGRPGLQFDVVEPEAPGGPGNAPGEIHGAELAQRNFVELTEEFGIVGLDAEVNCQIFQGGVLRQRDAADPALRGQAHRPAAAALDR